MDVHPKICCSGHGDLPNGPAEGFLEARSRSQKDFTPVLNTPMTHQGGLTDFAELLAYVASESHIVFTTEI